MKLRKLINEVIEERKQVGMVYHFTKLARAINIVQTDLIKSHQATQNIRRKTISTTRNKNFSKHRSGPLQIGGVDVAFVLNGDGLSDRYEVMPYDDTYDQGRQVHDDDAKETFGDEQEELWYGKRIDSDGGIKNVKRYTFKLIFSNRLKKAIVQNPDTLEDVDYLEKLFPNLFEMDVSPIQKLAEIKKWFEDKGYHVEYEK